MQIQNMNQNNHCRTCSCLTTTKSFDLKKEKGMLGKIELLTGMKMVLCEKYPSNICEICVQNLNAFINFRNQVIQRDKEIQGLINAVKVETEEIKIEFEEYSNDSDKNLHFVNIVTTSDLEIRELVKTEKEQILKNEETKRKLKTSNPLQTIINQHKTLQTPKNKYYCSECNATFSQKQELSKHRKTLHQRGICNICGADIRLDNISRHIQMHKETPVSCKVCGKVCKNSESLRSHMILHKGLIYNCDSCGRVFKVKSEYHRHLKSHKDPTFRRSTCELCGKIVRDLKKHILCHTGERPYTCEHCLKGFTSPYALKVHVRLHTQEKPFICEYCSMGFTQKVSLSAHLKTQHSS